MDPFISKKQVSLPDLPEESEGSRQISLPAITEENPVLPAFPPSAGKKTPGRKVFIWILILSVIAGGIKGKELYLQKTEADLLFEDIHKKCERVKRQNRETEKKIEEFKNLASKNGEHFMNDVRLVDEVNALYGQVEEMKRGRGVDPNDSLRKQVASLENRLSQARESITQLREEAARGIRGNGGSISEKKRSDSTEDKSYYIEMVRIYLNARQRGDLVTLEQYFGNVVEYQYSGYNQVPRAEVLRDIEKGWRRWVARSYELVRIGAKGRNVEIVFSFDLRDAKGKRAKGTSKEIWKMNADDCIISWREEQKNSRISSGYEIYE